MRPCSLALQLPLASSLLVCALASCECAPPVDPPTSFVTTSGDTQLTVDLAPFALHVNNASTTTSANDPSCAPLALGLRADDDLRDWHRPQAPRGDELWLRSTSATLVSESPLTVNVALADDAGRAKNARVIINANDDGWVDVDVTFEENELNVALISTCFALASDEHAVGGGERFDGVDLRNKIVPLQFEAPGDLASGTNEAHAPVPFFASNKGYAFLLESERVGAFDVGVTSPDATVVRAQGVTLPLRFRAGDIVGNAAAHARKMGLPPAPPRWALAPMQWRNDLEVELDADGNVVTSGVDMLLGDIEELRTRGIPTTTVWIDAPWETGYNTFVFNEQQLPEIDAVLAELNARGFRVLTWATEHVNNSDDSGQAFGMPEFATRDMFNAYEDAGFLVSTSTGAPFEFPWGRGNGGYVDFTNPAACDAWRAEIRPMLERGVNGFKLDYGETMRADVLGQLANDLPVFSDGTTTSVQHTRYARLYHECYLQALDEVHGRDDAFIITRTGGIFDQKNGTAIWPGDLDTEFERTGEPDANGELAVGGIPAAVNGFLSLQMSAYPLYGADVGGYRGGTPSTEAWLRWAQAGALSTIMQVGGGGNQAAWDPELVDVIDAFAVAARLHMDLVPMWEHWLARASSNGGDGTPVAIPVGAFASSSEEAWSDAFSYVIGGDLLAAPVVEAGARAREVFVPAGRWRSWWDGALVDGGAAGKLVTVAAPLEQVPLFQREDAILVLSHPQIVTLLPNGAEPGGDDDMGALRVVRVMGSAGAAQAIVGDIIAARTVDDAGVMRVDVLADAPRPMIIDAWLGGAFTLVSEAELVDSEAALIACAQETAPCALVEAGRVRVAATGRDVALELQVETETDSK